MRKSLPVLCTRTAERKNMLARSCFARSVGPPKPRSLRTMKKTPLYVLLGRYSPGTWVILDPTMSNVISDGKTLKIAMKKAGIPPTLTVSQDKARRGKRPVAMQVIDPTMSFF
jgi:hypothetical protein